MSKQKILGIDLGTNSIGWALLEADNGKPNGIIDLGSRIFIKAVEEKTPTPKNVKRRDSRLARRVVQRRTRRKQRMLNYLIKLRLLPQELQAHAQPEIILNTLGDPYQLRARGLDYPLSPHEMGRVLLHLVQRRGFLSNRKTLLGDMVDDPDLLETLAELEDKEDTRSERAKEESAFKEEIRQLRNTIQAAEYRTLGEYLASLDHHDCKRNRSREGGHLRTDRQMYRDELDRIWQQQQTSNPALTDEVKEQIEQIIFYQRPLKLRSDRIGKCSLEPKRNRARIARLECQHARYLQDINHLKYFDPYSEEWVAINQNDRQKLIALLETKAAPTFKTDVRTTLGLSKGTEFNLDSENKKLKGNITACEIRAVYPEWDKLGAGQQQALVEDLLTIQKKSVLKKRLITRWDIDRRTAVNLCMVEFEPGHSNHSTKATNRLLPYLQQGQRYDEARVSAGYGYEVKAIEVVERLGIPPETPNPIVSKALHELRRLVNAIIAEYGKPDVIRIEMARDLEMNSKKYKAFEKQQKANTKANDEAVEKYQEMGKSNPHLQLSRYPSKHDKIRYRLWKEQDQRCAYSNQPINLTTLFSAKIEIDHILPYSESLDDSYMNKVVCYADENRFKGQRTPIDAFSGDEDKWEQITKSINHWHRGLRSKRDRFYQTAADVQQRDFISSQLNDVRYISKVAQGYLAQLGADITTCKGASTAWVRHQWGLNSLIGESDKKERSDHRHHAIDAVAIACIDRTFYKTLVGLAKELERRQSAINIKNLHFDPPWEGLRYDLKTRLDEIIVAHTPQKRLSGELHTQIASGFSEGKGTVYRQNMNSEMTLKKADGIIDDSVRAIVKEHLDKHDNKPKTAFAQGMVLFHKDGKTPIKRVRIVRSSQIKTIKKLMSEQYGSKDKSGNIFKWQPYGNIHHIEVLQNNSTNSYIGLLVTMMEAHRRAMTGTKHATKRAVSRENIIKKQHGSNYYFIMALHKQDTVSLSINGKQEYFTVKALGQMSQKNQPRLILSPNTNSGTKDGQISNSISNLLEKYELKLHSINAIGKLGS